MRPSIIREERRSLRTAQISHLDPLGVLTAVGADPERGMKDVERAVEGIDDAHGSAIHPREPLVGAIDAEVSIHWVRVEAGHVVRAEAVADPVWSQGICKLDLSVAVAVTDRIDRTAAYARGVSRFAGLQMRSRIARGRTARSH